MEMRRRGRKWAVLAALGVLAVAGVLALEWREVRLRYRAFRLERARTLEEARPWQWALVREAGERPQACRWIVGRLGAERPYFTLWVFHLWENGGQGLRRDASLQAFLLASVEALERDAALLRLWTHYLRWRRNAIVEALLVQNALFRGQMSGRVPRPRILSPEEAAAQAQSLHGLEQRLFYAAGAWLFPLGSAAANQKWGALEMTPIGSSFPLIALQMEVRLHADRLHFDAEEGRFLLSPGPVQGSLADRAPPPAVPFPGWPGPAPFIPLEIGELERRV